MRAPRGQRRVEAIALVMAMSAVSASSAAPPDFFPPLSKSQRSCEYGSAVDERKNQWFSYQLKAAEENSLFAQTGRSRPANAETVRFTWLRSFDFPIVVRVVWDAAGSATIQAKRLSGRGGYKPGTIAQQVTRPLRPQEAQRLRTDLIRTRLFERAAADCLANEKVFMSDGAEWIIEDLNARGYHVAVRQSPEVGAVRDIGLAMLALTGWRVDPIY